MIPERYAAWCRALATGIEAVAPPQFADGDYAGVGITAGMDLGMTFALEHPALARRLVELYNLDAGLTSIMARAEKAATLRELRRLIAGDA